MLFKRKSKLQKIKERIGEVDKKQLALYTGLVVLTLFGLRKRLMQ